MRKMILYSTIIAGAVACCGQPKATATAEAPETATLEVVADTVKGQLCGGYGEVRAPKAEELELFSKTIAELDGVGYTAELVSTQIVAGTNYKFICSARTATLNPESYKAAVVIYVPLPHTKKEPRIISITRLD